MSGLRFFVAVGSLLLVAAVLSSCSFGVVVGSGRSTTETRDVSDFSALEFAFLGNLTITKGDAESLTITGDDNIVSLIRTRVSNGVLRIDAGSTNVGRTIIPLEYELIVKNLDSVNLSGLGSIGAAELSGDRVTLVLSGAGTLRVDDLNADELSVTMAGLGDANVAGVVNRQTVTVSGAGSYYAADLRSQTAKVTISGLGSAEVWPVETLSATISGAGSIQYAGSPQVTQQVSGLGSIEALGEK